MKKLILICGLWVLLTAHSFVSTAQTFYQYKGEDATLCFTNRRQAQYVPYLMRKYELGKALHQQIWGELPSQNPLILLEEWEDDGTAGVSSIPRSFIDIGMSPLNVSYFTTPAYERYEHLFKHEYTHVVMADKAQSRDKAFRKFTMGKIVLDSNYPMSALWSYLGVPRRYAPSWYQEGIACLLETWLGDGVGRALGGYDDAYFRTLVKEGKKMYNIVGLETEGVSSDFQSGTAQYLYGTRFVNYLTLTYGFDKVVDFYNRTDDSKAAYPKQFKSVYGKNIRDAWDDWIDYEKDFQTENLELITEYPVTEVDHLLERSLGSASPMILDEEENVIYAAVNHPGDFAKIVRMSLDESGRKVTEEKTLAFVDGSKAYLTAYLAYDRKGQRLIWTDRNSKIRGLVIYDLKEGRKIEHLKFQRMYEICYDNVNDCLYGLMNNQGVTHLVRYDSEFKERTLLYSFPFGVSVSNLDASHDGTRIVASLLGANGEQSLIMFDLAALEEADHRYETLLTMDDTNLSQFRFSADDRRLVGFSYYTGVPNVWSYDLETEDFDLLSNVETGLFGPYLSSDGTVYAYELTSEGMSPVAFDYKVLHDANSVEYLGQKALEANPQLAGLSTLKEPLPELSFGEVYDSLTLYKPLKELKFQGAYPDISGFTDRKAWNNVTPVLGYNVTFYDPVGYFHINLHLGVSPWSNNEWKNRFHASAELKYLKWKFTAAWNPTNFYDLFGPRRASRKGYQFGLEYKASHSMQSPFVWDWGWSVGHYGGMDALPLYQEVAVDEGITSFQTADIFVDMNKKKTSIGGITPERGYGLSAEAYTYLADGKLFPSIDLQGELGFPIPIGIHNSFWMKGALGQSFGDSSSSLGNSYFGGFRNNYVDNGAINRFSSLKAMPGARIDQIKAHRYAKMTGEIDLCPIRFQDLGLLQCYPNYMQFCLFGNGLMTDNGKYLSAGVQMNIQMVIFTYMKTTLSFGYARAWGNNLNQGEFLISLKLL